jgi:hypothetical protein
MAAPVIDGSATVNNWSTSASKTITLSTTLTNDLVVVAVFHEKSGGLQNITGMTSTSGLVFTRRSKKQNTAATEEVWAAPSTAILTGEVITVNLDAATDDACIIAFGIHGLNDITNPFDTNVSLPASGISSTNTPPTLTYSTTEANDLILFITGGNNGSSGSTAPSGFTNLANIQNSGGGLFACLSVNYKAVTATQSGATVQATATATAQYVSIVDAVTADAAVSVRTGVGVIGFGGAHFTGGASLVTPTAAGAMAFGPPRFNAAGNPGVTSSGSLHFGGVKIAALGAGLKGGGSSVNPVVAANVLGLLQPLTWNVPIVDAKFFPTPEFQNKWQKQFNIIKRQQLINQSIVPKSYVDQSNVSTLAGAQQYTDAQGAVSLAAAKAYADTGDAATLAAAKVYADTGDAATLVAAEAYTDLAPVVNAAGSLVLFMLADTSVPHIKILNADGVGILNE